MNLNYWEKRLKSELTANTLRQALLFLIDYLKKQSFPAGKNLKNVNKTLADLKARIEKLEKEVARLSRIVTNLLKALGES